MKPNILGAIGPGFLNQVPNLLLLLILKKILLCVFRPPLYYNKEP